MNNVSLAAAIMLAATGTPVHVADDGQSTAASAAPSTPNSSCTQSSVEPKKKKRKGLGLGGLLGAANQAGVGRLLGSGMLGSGAGEQMAGAALGTAIEVASKAGAQNENEQAAQPGTSLEQSGAGCTPEQATATAGN